MPVIGFDQDVLNLPLPMALGVIVLSAVLQDDITCLVVGMYVAAGNVLFFPAVAACFVGTLVGDLMWFFLGRFFGAACFTRAPIKWVVTPQHLQQAQSFVDKHGATAILLTRFIPVIRTPVQVVAGAFSPRVTPLLVFFTVAAFFYAPLMVLASTLLGNAVNIYSLYQRFGHLALLAVGVSLWLLLISVRLVWRRRT